MSPIRSAAILALVLAGAGCSPAPQADPGHEEPLTSTPTAEPDSDELSATVHLEGLRGVTVAAVGPPIAEGVWYPAEAIADATERTMISAPIAGIVLALDAPPGREVASGATLVTLRSPELAHLKAAWLTRRALLDQAASARAREARLAEARAGSARELETAQAAEAVARAEEEAARLALLAYGVDPATAGSELALRAPRRGRVASYAVLAGQGVAAGQELGLFEVGSGTLIRVELALPGPDSWTPGSETTVRRSDGRTWTARVEGLPTSLSQQTHRLEYRLRLSGSEPPYPGTPLEVRVPLPRGIVVPQGAIQQVEGTWGVFVVDGDQATFRRVRRGPELGGDVVVLEGVAPGDRIATDGAFLLKALLLKESGEGDSHDH